MLDEYEKMLIIKNLKQRRLPKNPTLNDLLMFSWLKNKKKWKRNKRLYKRFQKNWKRYVSESVRHQYLASIMCMPLRRRVDYSEIARKVVSVAPLKCEACGMLSSNNLEVFPVRMEK